MNKKIILTLSALALAIPLVTACNSQTTNPEAKKASMEQAVEVANKHRAESYGAVKAIIDVYASNLPGNLETLVSDNYLPSKMEFINHVEQRALDKTITNILFSVNKAILSTESKLSVDFKWDRTFMPKGSATQFKDSGQTNFVFVKEPNEWRLLQMSGSDIF